MDSAFLFSLALLLPFHTNDSLNKVRVIVKDLNAVTFENNRPNSSLSIRGSCRNPDRVSRSLLGLSNIGPLLLFLSD